jgi:hypothetical protein
MYATSTAINASEVGREEGRDQRRTCGITKTWDQSY